MESYIVCLGKLVLLLVLKQNKMHNNFRPGYYFVTLFLLGLEGDILVGDYSG